MNKGARMKSNSSWNTEQKLSHRYAYLESAILAEN